MRLILDATPLIHLTKVGFHLYFSKLGVELITTEEVLKEIFAADFPENAAIKKLIESEKIKVKNPQNTKPVIGGTHIGEVSVIFLASEMGAIAIIDDELGRAYATSLGVKVFYSTFLIIRAVVRTLISKQEAMVYIDKMIEKGWRCDVSTYKEILSKIQSIK